MQIIRVAYVYLISFVTLMMVIGGGVGIFMALSDIISPTTYYQSYTDYKQMREKEVQYGQEQKPVVISEEQIKQEFDDLVKSEKERTKNRAFNSLIKSFGWVIIPLPFFIYFQRRIREVKQ